MKKWIVIFSLLLAVQIGLAAMLNLRQDQFAAFEPQEKLLSFEPALVTEVRIETMDKAVELKKVAGQWQLPQLADFPADQDKVGKLLEKLAKLEKGWPVATTASAVRRFKVAKEDFERRITLLKDGNEVAQMYLGTSPGFRKVHARGADDNAIVAIPFSLFEVNAKQDDWIDKNVLEVPVADITRVEMPQFTLSFEDGAWRLADLKEGEAMQERAADDLVGKLAALQIDGVFTEDTKVEKDPEGDALSFTLVPESGDTLRYELTPLKGGQYLLSRSDRKERFKVAAWRISPIEETTRDKLVQVAEKLETDESASSPAPKAQVDGGETGGGDA